MLDWIQNHWQEILAAWGALVAFATVIVKLTPTTRDDSILTFIVKLFDWFSVVNPNKPKQ